MSAARVDAAALLRELPAAVTVCDGAGTILEMNDRAARMFGKRGGRALIGSSLLDCHPEPARAVLLGLLARREANAYTVEKGGRHRMVWQAPWYASGEYGGLVEVVFEIPAPLPHRVRDAG